MEQVVEFVTQSASAALAEAPVASSSADGAVQGAVDAHETAATPKPAMTVDAETSAPAAQLEAPPSPDGSEEEASGATGGAGAASVGSEGAEADADAAAAPAGPTMLQLLHAAEFSAAVEQADGRCVVPVSNMPSALGRCNVVVESMAFTSGELSMRHIWIPLLGLAHAKTLPADVLLTIMATAGRLPYVALEVKGGHLALCAKLPAFLPPKMLQTCISVLILTADTVVANEPALADAITAARGSV